MRAVQRLMIFRTASLWLALLLASYTDSPATHPLDHAHWKL